MVAKTKSSSGKHGWYWQQDRPGWYHTIPYHSIPYQTKPNQVKLKKIAHLENMVGAGKMISQAGTIPYHTKPKAKHTMLKKKTNL